MARTLDPQIMTDPWFIELDDRARLGWLMLILNGADDQGRFLMNGRLLKSLLFPADDLPASEVLAMLEGFAANGKVYAYEKGGIRYGQIVNWWKYQIGSEWMAPSRHPAPPGWVDRWRIHAKGGKGLIETSPSWNDKKLCGFISPEATLPKTGHEGGAGNPQSSHPEPDPGSVLGSDSGTDLGKQSGNDLGKSSGHDLGHDPGKPSGQPLPSREVKVKGEVKDKGESEVEKADDPPVPAVFSENPFTVYEQNIGPLTPAVSERIKLAETEYPPGWVEEAIRLAARRNKRRWDYAEGILRNWHRDGKDDGEKPEKSYADELVAAGYSLPDRVPAEWLV